MTEIDLVKADEEDAVEAPEVTPEESAAEASDAAGDPSDEEQAAEEQAPEQTDEAAEPTKKAKPEPKLGPGEALDDEALVQQTAALLFASPEPISLDRLVQLLERPARARVRECLAELERRFEAGPLPLTLAEIAGGWRLLSRPEMGEVIQRLAKVRKAEKVTPAMLETLAIVAYRQPVTNAEVEAIRGVQSGAMLRSLVDRGLAKVTGRADQPGSPLQYGTTKEFLNRFGLASIKDLPRDGELAKD